MDSDVIRLVGDLERNMAQVVLGKIEAIRMCLVALLAGEHVLLEDVPGVGKTLVAKALSRSVHGSFCRIQFTPDLLPSDIVGSSIYDAQSGQFHFNRGPIFANVVLADEINRTPPRTQSALLEAMSDGQASVDGVTHDLPSPFIVIATQNPFEFEGTYPLPESQLDRFLIRISMGYPAREDERQVLMSHRNEEPVDNLRPIIECQQILQLQKFVRQVTVEESIYDYLLDIVAATRENDELRVGVSTRGRSACIGQHRPWRPSEAAHSSSRTTSSSWRCPCSPTALSPRAICMVASERPSKNCWNDWSRRFPCRPDRGSPFMFQRCRFSVPHTTWVYVAILGVVVVGAIMREINLLIILSGMMCGPLAISWQLIRMTLRDLEVKRRVPAGVLPGAPFTVELQVRNGRRRLGTWALRIEDRVRNVHAEAGTAAARAICLIPYIAAEDRQVTSYRGQLWNRGRYRFGPIRLSTEVPVGLLKGHVTHKISNDVLVYPRLGKLQAGWADLVKFDQQGHRSWQRRHGPVEGDFYGLREWRSGDSRRWIHWRTSAKRDELVVRQFEQHRSQNLVVLLDLLYPATADAVRETVLKTIELAVSFTATLVAEQCRRGGGRLTLGVAGREVNWLRGSASRALLDDSLELLAEVQGSATDRLAEVLPPALSATSADDRILLVSLQDVRLDDPIRFPDSIGSDSRRARLAQAICVNASSPRFADVFSFEPSEPDEATAPAAKEHAP